MNDKLIIGILGPKSSGKTYTWNSLFGRTVKTGKNLRKLFLNDKEDLIHKSTGWMLREVAKRDCECIETFLEDFGCRMPRTMLRYTIELFPEKLRRHYLESTREIVCF